MQDGGTEKNRTKGLVTGLGGMLGEANKRNLYSAKSKASIANPKKASESLWKTVFVCKISEFYPKSFGFHMILNVTPIILQVLDLCIEFVDNSSLGLCHF